MHIVIVEQLENSTPSTLKIPMASTKKDAIVATAKIREWGDWQILEIVGEEEHNGILVCSNASWEGKTWNCASNI